MNTMKKIVFAALIGVFGTVGIVSISPARAQEVTANAQVDTTIEAVRQARQAFTGDRNNLEARRVLLDTVVRGLEMRGKEHREMSPEVRKVVDARERDLVTFKARIKKARTEVELRGIAKEIQEHRKSETVRMAVLESFIAKLDNAITIAEKRSVRLGEMLADLASQNREVAPLQDLLTQANRRIADARQTLTTVTESIRTAEGDFNLGQTKQGLKDVSNILKDVYRLFIEIWKSSQAF